MPSPFKETPIEPLRSKKEDNICADELVSDDEFVQQSIQSNAKIREILKDSSTRVINKGKEVKQQKEPIQLEINLMDGQEIFNQNVEDQPKDVHYYPEESRDT